MLPELLLTLAVDQAEAATPRALTETELHSQIDARRAAVIGQTDPSAPQYEHTDAALDSVVGKLKALYESKKKVFLDVACDHFSFENAGVAGQLKCMSDGGMEIKVGDDTFYFETQSIDAMLVYINGVKTPATDPRFLRAVEFAIAGMEAAIAHPKFTPVDASDAAVIANGGAPLRGPGGKVSFTVNPGEMVAVVGTTDSEGRAFVYTNTGMALTEGWLNVGDLANMESAVTPAPTDEKETFETYIRYVSPSTASNGGLNLRNAPDSAPAALTGNRIPENTEVTVVGEDASEDSHDWVEVTYMEGASKQKGWVSGDYLTEEQGKDPEFQSYKATVSETVGADGLNLRDVPKASAETVSTILVQIPAGQQVKVVGIDGPDWIKVEVRIKGKKYTGYVATKHLKTQE